jgi:hypothetical protein
MFINYDNLNYGERELVKWQYKKLSGFGDALWLAIQRADTNNLDALEKGFPDQVIAYRRFSRENGYWEDVMSRISKEEI